MILSEKMFYIMHANYRLHGLLERMTFLKEIQDELYIVRKKF